MNTNFNIICLTRLGIEHESTAPQAEALTEWRDSSPRGLWHGQHSYEETLQRWRAVSGTVSNLTGTGIETQTSHTVSDVFDHNANQPIK